MDYFAKNRNVWKNIGIITDLSNIVGNYAILCKTIKSKELKAPNCIFTTPDDIKRANMTDWHNDCTLFDCDTRDFELCLIKLESSNISSERYKIFSALSQAIKIGSKSQFKKFSNMMEREDYEHHLPAQCTVPHGQTAAEDITVVGVCPDHCQSCAHRLAALGFRMERVSAVRPASDRGFLGHARPCSPHHAAFPQCPGHRPCPCPPAVCQPVS